MIFKNSPVQANFTVLNIGPPKIFLCFEILPYEVVFKSDLDHKYVVIDPTLPCYLQSDLTYHITLPADFWI